MVLHNCLYLWGSLADIYAMFYLEVLVHLSSGEQTQHHIWNTILQAPASVHTHTHTHTHIPIYSKEEIKR